MNATVKTILLTVLTLSVFAIALVELSGVSRTALFNRFEGPETHERFTPDQQAERDAEVNKMAKTTIEIAETKYDFGKIKEGEKVRHAYQVKNVGTSPLLIANVQASCGCTVPSFPKNPIAPGETGEVTLEFNSEGRPGSVMKNALIIANADNAPFSIGFTAEVEPKK
ncbi:MAG: DUF1573 domain-containing protein [Chitinophagaceae bacterium]|nr:DUF1573 domain-containing protein [Chitinophagaceae bacterium]